MKFFFNLYLASIPISEKHSDISSLELLVISGAWNTNLGKKWVKDIFVKCEQN